MPYLVMGVASLLGDTSESTRCNITGIIARVDGNIFNVTDATHVESVGVALYGTASLINHSCDPNSLVVFNGRELTLKAMATLRPGDQVTLSLTPSLPPTSMNPLLYHPFNRDITSKIGITLSL